MYHVCYTLSVVNASMPDYVLNDLNAEVVMGLARVNLVLLKYWGLPSIYQKQPKYHVPQSVQTGKEREQWKDVFKVLRDGWGDCKDFTAWRLAELWQAGIDAKAESTVMREGEVLVFHTYIRYPDGRTEDPAKTLGMP